MGDKCKKFSTLGSALTTESVKVVAESVGVSGISDETLHFLADDATYRLKLAVQEAVKFMHHGKRRKMSTADFDNALKVHNIEPLYTFNSSEFIPFRQASGGGREVHFVEDKDIDLDEIIHSQPPKIPVATSLRTHWLAIEGEQPSVPENPPQVSRDMQRLEGIDPSVKNAINRPGGGLDRTKVKMSEKVRLKELTTHQLSVEQQLYYKEVTEACVGSDETRRSEALHSLTSEPGLYQMLPHFSTFISEGVKVNVMQNNLALLIYLMRMMKSLMDNPTLYLEKYLHELIPALMSCIISRQLCLRPDIDNHWALRDFASKLLSQLCKSFSTCTNTIQTRITKMLSTALQNDTAPLATHYGAIVGIGELGFEVIKVFLLPVVRSEADRLQTVLEGPLGNNTDRIAAEHVKQALLKLMPAVLKVVHSANDTVDDYRAQYGFLGPALHAAVTKLRQQAAIATSTTTAGGSLGPPTRLTQSSGPSRQLSVFPAARPMLQQQQQKQFVLVTPSAASASSLYPSASASLAASPANPLVKVLSSSQKIVVVSAKSSPS